MSDRPDLAALRRKLAAQTRGFGPGVPSFSLGSPALDEALNGGLQQGALHEIFALRTPDQPAAAGFCTALAALASSRGESSREVVWVRQRYGAIESGGLYAPGLAEMGLDPARIVLVDVRDAADVLRAGEEAARCSVLGAVLIEVWGVHKVLDLTATRRLALAAEHSGVPLLMLRAGATPAPSAASTRWSVKGAVSRALEADAPGHPAFAVNLLRTRSGASARTWIVEWNRERRSFDDITPAARTERHADSSLSGGLVPVSPGGPAETGSIAERRTG